MEVTLQFDLFRKMLKEVTQIYCASELGGEAAQSDDGAAMFLRACAGTLFCEASCKGLEVTGSMPIAATALDGTVAVKMGALHRLSGQADQITLTRAGKSLALQSGRFNAEVATIAQAKMSRYDEVPLTHTIETKLLRAGIKAAGVQDLPEGHALVRLRWDSAGARVFSHTVYFATHTAITADPAEPIEFTFNGALAEGVCSTAEQVQFGTDGKSYRFKTTEVDMTHPIKAHELEDMDLLVRALKPDEYPRFDVTAKVLSEALEAVGSIDTQTGQDAKRAYVELTCCAPKEMVVLSTKTSIGFTTQQISVVGVKNIDVECFALVNHRALSAFVGRLKGRELTVAMLPDRVVLHAGPSLYVVTLVQED